MLKRELIEAISHIEDDEDIRVVFDQQYGDRPEDGDLLDIKSVGYEAGTHVLRAELPE